jgi:hypothetical protein
VNKSNVTRNCDQPAFDEISSCGSRFDVYQHGGAVSPTASWD